MAKYGREVIDRVRVDEANRLRADRHARHLVKGARGLLLRNRENVTREADQVRLRELLAANRALMVAYVEDLSTSVVPEIGTLRSVGAGGGSSPLATRCDWKRDT